MNAFRSLVALGLGLAAAAALAAEAPKTELTWYGHAAFKVKTPGGTALLLDPWLSNPSAADKEAVAKLDQADFILVTHGHFDHVGDTVAIAKKTGAKVVASFELGTTLAGEGLTPEQAGFGTLGNVGGTLKLNDEVSVTLVPAVHSSSWRKDDKSPYADAGPAVGFVVQIKNGPTLYHTGDTDVFGDMKLIGERFNVDLMLGCIGGHFTMDPKGAALAATLVKAKKFVPMHFGTFPILTGKPADLAAELKARKAKAAVLEMAIGETKGL